MHKKIQALKKACQEWLASYECITKAEQATQQTRYQLLQQLAKGLEQIPSEAATVGTDNVAPVESGAGFLEIIKGAKTLLQVENLV